MMITDAIVVCGLVLLSLAYCISCTRWANEMSRKARAMQIPDGEASFVRALDAQREAGKAIYGGGFLLSEKAAAEKAAAEKAAAEKAAAEKAAATRWPLSDRERAIIAAMGAEAAP